MKNEYNATSHDPNRYPHKAIRNSQFSIRNCLMWAVIILAIFAVTVHVQAAEGDEQTQVRKSAWDFVRSAGWVGYAIIALSIVAGALVVDSFLRLKVEKLLPPGPVAEAEELCRKGRFSQVMSICKTHDSLICRVIAGGLSQGSLGLAAVREAMQDRGVKELTRLNQRVGYLGFIATIALMLGLLGTVTGMISSFNILGSSKGTARPDELAIGIAEALVNTAGGLVLALPLMFLHSYFRDRVARLGQDVSGICERLLRIMSVIMERRVEAGTTNGRPAADDEVSDQLGV